MRREHEPLELPTEFDRKLGRRLARIREQAGLSRFFLAIMVDVDESEIEAWEQGLMVMYIDELKKVCEALKISPNHLTGKDEQ